MSHRRIYETIGVRYDDIDRVPIILAEIREYLIGSHGGEIAFPTRTLHVAGDVHLAGLPAERR